MADAQRIPAFVNKKSGAAEGARKALATGPFDVHEIEPDQLAPSIAEALKAKPKRILVSGGDGTIRTGVQAVAGTGVELAVLPSGTLNHFSKDHNIPTDLDEAARIAAGSVVSLVDVGRVGEYLFHGTSSIGAYVAFMKRRDRLERTLGYKIATFVAGIWTFFTMPTLAVELEVGGKAQIYRTPLVFIGVGERELKIPTLGGRIEGGKRGLHVMVVKGRRRARWFLLALDAFSRGVKNASREPELDSFIVEKCTISTRARRTRISLDGEAQNIDTPLEYALERDILLLVGGEMSHQAGDATLPS